MITNERKQNTCNKYHEYLMVIDILGNKMMLQRQFIDIIVILGIAKDKFQAIRGIQELERAEIIKK